MSIFEEYQDLYDPIYIENYSYDRCPTRLDPKGPIFELDVAVALIQFDGNISRVAAALHRTRRTIDTFIARNIKLGDLQEDLKGMFLDEVEDQAKAAAKSGDRGMVKFVLGTQGRDRGYVTRQETTGKKGEAVQVQFFLPENNRDPAKEEDVGD